jgi:WD40 repeat protein
MRILILLGIGSMVMGLAAREPTTNEVAGRSCPKGGQAGRFGPAMSPGDSGKVYSSVLSADGKEFYFFKQVGPGQEDYRIFRSKWNSGSGRWNSAELLDLGGDYSDLYPAPSPDGKRLVFSSYRPAPDDTSSHPNAHLWYVVRIDHDWAEPRFIRASTYGYYHSGLISEADGSVRYNRTTPDWRTTEQFHIRWLDTAYAVAEQLSPNPAAEYWRQHLGDSVYVWGAVAGPDGLALVQISRVGANGRRSPAVYFVSRQQGNEWSELVPAGGGLGEGSPNFAWFSRDSCYIHYTRDYTSFRRVPLADVVEGH